MNEHESLAEKDRGTLGLLREALGSIGNVGALLERNGFKREPGCRAYKKPGTRPSILSEEEALIHCARHAADEMG